jgi:hypothetical protein
VFFRKGAHGEQARGLVIRRHAHLAAEKTRSTAVERNGAGVGDPGRFAYGQPAWRCECLTTD